MMSAERSALAEIIGSVMVVLDYFGS